MDRAEFKVVRGRDRRTFLILCGMALALLLLLALWATRSINPLRGDSAEYLYFDRSRSLGYPAFLELIRLLTGRVALAVPAQMTLLAVSLLALGWSFYRSFGRQGWSLVFVAALLAQPGMWFSSAFIMTEALSTALVALWCALVVRGMRGPSFGQVALMTAISTAAMVVRPPLAALFLGNLLLGFGMAPGRDRARALLMIAAGLMLAWAATPVAQFVVHGSARTTSPFARGVLQHTLYCDPRSVQRDPDSAFVEQVAAPVRAYIASAPADVGEQLRREYSTPLRFGLIIPALGRRHQVELRSAVDPFLAPIARERVAANPGCYAFSVVDEYARMAIFDTDPTAEDGRRASAFIGSHPQVAVAQLPLLPGDQRLALRAAHEVGSAPAGLNPPSFRLNVIAKVPFVALLPFRILFGIAALIGFAAVVALAVRRRVPSSARPLILPIAAMGIAFHGILFITAIVEIGFFRYLVPLWPIVCCEIAMAAIASRSLQRRHDR